MSSFAVFFDDIVHHVLSPVAMLIMARASLAGIIPIPIHFMGFQKSISSKSGIS